MGRPSRGIDGPVEFGGAVFSLIDQPRAQAFFHQGAARRRVAIAGVGGEFVPGISLDQITRHAGAVVIQRGQIELRLDMPLAGRQFEPAGGFGVIAHHRLAILMKCAHDRLGLGGARLGERTA